MMRFKELTVVGILAIFVAVIIISFQENDDPIVTIENFENRIDRIEPEGEGGRD